MAGQFKYLFSPLKVGHAVLRNRIFFPAHLTNFAEDNLPSERLACYYAERARGGAALIITEEQSVHPTDRAYEKLIHAFDPKTIPGYRLMTRMVHREGALIFAQLNHNGAQGSSLYTRRPLWAPSPIPDPLFREVPKEMEKKDIKEVIEGFARSARHVKEGGFDGIEIQASHSSLIRQFLSPYTNRRNDEYGPENRLRFCLEVLDAVRQVVGWDLVVGIRLCGDELLDGGLTLNDTLEIARELEAQGLPDYINTSIATATHALYMVVGSMHLPPGYSLFIPSALREAVDLPVFGVGRIKDPFQAEHILAEGHADMVGMVRALIADPELPNKAREGRAEEVRFCLSCNQGCIGRVGLNADLSCVQNPAAGRERQLGAGTLQPAGVKKRVLVIGGGPAGMEAARVAALRGHEVVLCEKEDEPGGQVNLAARAPGRDELGDLVRNLLGDLRRLGVEIRLGTAVTAEVVEKEGPDAVVVATGSVAAGLPIPGAGQENVFDVREVLKREAKVGRRVALIDGVGFHQATGTAEFLAEQGRDVIFLTSALYAGQGLGPTLDLELWHRRARSKGIAIVTNVTVLEIVGDTLRLLDHYSGREWRIEGIDTFVTAAPGRADDELYFLLKGRVKELYRVGDCVAPRNIQAAVLEGHLAGRAV